MPQGLLLPHPVAPAPRVPSLALASCDVIWRIQARSDRVWALRLTLSRRHAGLTQTILTLGPDATQAVAVPAGAGETLYGTVDVLHLPTGPATLYGNISLSSWLPGATYILNAALWVSNSAHSAQNSQWRQEGQAIEWTLPDLNGVPTETVRTIAPWTPFATLRLVIL